MWVAAPESSSKAMSQNSISSRRRIIERSYRTPRLERCSPAHMRLRETSSTISTSSTSTTTTGRLIRPMIVAPVVVVVAPLVIAASTMTATPTTSIATPSSNTPSSGLSVCLKRHRWNDN
ncbi:hypothetical protein CRG98_020020 [Punica granatum]|uniref:Uncharacterized protein n=1 Tax=Punica granatum TaxID=22663 RepID=A0A2I0JTL3_PUNGR|nr:hypothetical protein CRG98_020020 [Punica granatum]